MLNRFQPKLTDPNPYFKYSVKISLFSVKLGSLPGGTKHASVTRFKRHHEWNSGTKRTVNYS